ncbi:hypothetical protein CBM2608_B30141 [Cupriavidus taiwanensis]|nr:hypothetical protein CBM2608_B30141 [Cupriavidus taiwanensis]
MRLRPLCVYYGGNGGSLYFVDAPALTPTLSRKRERKHTI